MKNGETDSATIPPLKKIQSFSGNRAPGRGSIFQIYKQIRALYQIGKRCKSEGRDIVARVKRETMRKRIEKDLTNQLKEKKIIGNHYTDLIQDYLSLWDLKCILVDDIEGTGIKVSGMHGPKSNPSINDLHKTNDRMIKILDALGLEASAEEKKVPSKPARSVKDLT